MGIFTREDLLKSIKGKEQNPLRTIGFSSELLRIHLDDDQLWEFAKKAAQRLVVILHPDHIDTDEQAASVSIRQAFESLKDKDVFLRALDELRNEHNQVRSSENLRKRMTDQEQSKANEAERKYQEALKINNQLQRKIRGLRSQLVTNSGLETIAIRNPEKKSRYPLQQIRQLRQANQAIAIFVSLQLFVGTVQPKAALAATLKKYHQKRRMLQKRLAQSGQKLNDRITSGHVGEAHYDLVKGGFASRNFMEMVLEARQQIIPTLYWNLATFLDNSGVAKGEERKSRIVNARQAIEASSFDEDTFLTTYREMFENLVEFLSPQVDRISEIYIYPKVIDLTGGMLKTKAVVGSAFLEDGGVSIKMTPGLFDLGTYPEGLKHPYLCEGAMIAMFRPTEIGLIGRSARERVQLLPGQVAKKLNSKRMTSCYLLLELL